MTRQKRYSPSGAVFTDGAKSYGGDRVLEAMGFLTMAPGTFALLPRQNNNSGNPVRVDVGDYSSGDYINASWSIPFFYEDGTALPTTLAQLATLLVYSMDEGASWFGVFQTFSEVKMQSATASVEEPDKYALASGEMLFLPAQPLGAFAPRVALAFICTVDTGNGEQVRMLNDANMRPGTLFAEAIIPAAVTQPVPSLTELDITALLINPPFA